MDETMQFFCVKTKNTTLLLRLKNCVVKRAQLGHPLGGAPPVGGSSY